MDLMPAVDVLVPSPPTAVTTFNPPNFLERIVGEAVAVAASSLAKALGEFTDGGLTPATRGQGADSIVQLFRLKLFLAGDFPDWDAVAREQGVTALRAATDGEVSPVTCDLLVESVLEILGRVVKSELN